MRYAIDQGLLRHLLEVEIDGVPPCLFCGEPVTSPSMDGPLVCSSCDCGRDRGGSKWTEDQAEARHAHRRSKIAEYRVQMIDRRVREMKELLASMIEMGESREDGGASVSVAFMAAAWKLMPDLIERDALHGAEVAKWADASGTAKGERDVLCREVTELRAALAEACDLAPQTGRVTELRRLANAPVAPQTGRVTELRRLANAPVAVADVVAAPRVADLPGASIEERDREPVGISIDRALFMGIADQLRTTLHETQVMERTCNHCGYVDRHTAANETDVCGKCGIEANPVQRIVPETEVTPMKPQNWAVSARYATPGSRPSHRRHPAPEDFCRRTVVGPTSPGTVEAVLDLLEVPEDVRVKMRSNDVVRNFVEGRLVSDPTYPHNALGMHYVSSDPDAQLVEWDLDFAFVSQIIDQATGGQP